MHGAVGQALITLFFQIHGAQCYKSKENVVCITPEPDALSDGWADPATAGTTMTLVAARQPELLDEVRVVLRQLSVIRIGTMQLPLRDLLHQLGRRRCVPSLAAGATLGCRPFIRRGRL